MNEKASIGVLMPTLNCGPLLEDHINSANEWLDLVEEIVVVDSDSRDNTVEYIKSHLKHPNVRFLRHARGLYQSWNFGIQHINQKYTYVSTIGDSITRAGMLHLREVAEQHQCDAVASKPRFTDNYGKPIEDIEWPIDRIFKKFPEHQMLVLEGLILHLLAITDITGAILGSSASNLYLTRTFQKHPFPTEYGTAGDMVWGVMHALDARVALVTEKFSAFRFHPKAYLPSEYAVEDMEGKMLKLGTEAYLRHAAESHDLRVRGERMRVADIIRLKDELAQSSMRLGQFRCGKLPWVLKPAAWKERAMRDRYRMIIAEAEQATQEELQRLGLAGVNGSAKSGEFRNGAGSLKSKAIAPSKAKILAGPALTP